MKALAYDLSSGRLCTANIAMLTLGAFGQLTLKDWAQVFAAVATGLWFLTQTVLAIRAARQKRKG